MKPLIVLFARKPVPGRVKTRLGLHPELAARVHDAFVRHTLATLAEIDADIEISTDEPCAMWNTHRTTVQCPGDLGQKMYSAIARGLESRRPKVMILGSDSPELPPEHLNSLLASAADVALGPTEDGGYYAIACRRAHPRMFADVRWSSDCTLADTLHACRAAGLAVETGPAWFDVDRPEDLERLRSNSNWRALLG